MLAPIRFALRRSTTTVMLHTYRMHNSRRAHSRRARHVRGMYQAVLPTRSSITRTCPYMDKASYGPRFGFLCFGRRVALRLLLLGVVPATAATLHCLYDRDMRIALYLACSV